MKNRLFVFIALALLSIGVHQKSYAQPNKQHSDNYRYLLLTDADTSFIKTNHVELENGIELFNIFLDEHRLALFSVMPFTDGNNWVLVDKSLADKSTITTDSLKAIFNAAQKLCSISGGYNYSQLVSSTIKLVVKKNGDDYMPRCCQLQFFWIVNQAMMFANQMQIGIINPLSPPLTVKEYEEKYYNIYHQYSSNAIASTQATGASALARPLEKPLTFCSGQRKIAGRTGYQFWTFTDWPVTDGSNSQRGADRFIFVPDVGIMAASYDFWYQNINKDTLMNNYLNEQVYLPVKINGEKLKKL